MAAWYVSVVGRRVSSGNDYRLKVRYQAGGSVAAYLVRTLGNTETVLLSSTTVPGLTVQPSDQLRVRFQVSGTTDSTLRAKVWRAGTTEPAAWLISGSDATPGVLQSAGDLGVLLYISGSWTGTLPTNHARQPRRRHARMTKHERHEPGATAAGG